MQRAAAAVAALIALAACKRGGGDETVASQQAADAAATPVEHLAPGELVEGTEVAYGIKLPRDAQLERRYEDVVYATSNLGVQALAGYFQKRVRGGRASTTLNEASFEDCEVPGQPGLRVKIVVAFASRAGNTTIEVRNVTPPADTLPKDDSARWRAAGMTPEGKPLDPKQLH